MSAAAAALVLLNFAVIGLLPVRFFRRGGRLNARWWLTAAPFFAAPLLVVAAAAGALTPATDGVAWAAVPLAAGSSALIAYAARAHRVRIALWHQDADTPAELVTWGPYRWVRHPFYAAFLLTLTGAVALCPHPATLGAWGWGVVALHLTAAREERRLRASPPPLGAAYAAYMRVTGRFWPRWRHSARRPRGPAAAPRLPRSASRPA